MTKPEKKNYPDVEKLNKPVEKLGTQVTKSPLQSLLSQPNMPTTQFGSNQQMLDYLLSQQITPEEQAKRERAAAAVGAIGHMGNILSAFSNLAYSGSGAAPQTITPYQGPDTETWQDKARAKNLQYLSIMSSLEADKEDRLFRQKQEDNRMEIEKYDRSYKQERDAVKDRQYADELTEGRRQFDTTQALREKQLEEDIRHNKQSEGIQMLAEERRTKEQEARLKRMEGRDEENKPILKRVKGADGRVYEIDESVLYNKLGSKTGNSATAEQLYKKIPPEVKADYHIGIFGDFTDDAQKMANAIASVIEDDMAFFNEVKGYGILTEVEDTPLPSFSINDLTDYQSTRKGIRKDFSQGILSHQNRVK